MTTTTTTRTTDSTSGTQNGCAANHRRCHSAEAAVVKWALDHLGPRTDEPLSCEPARDEQG